MLEPLAQFEAWRAEGARFIAHGFFERAWRRMARDELDAALADFDRGLELDPSRRDALLARARLLIRLNRVEPASAALAEWLARADPVTPSAELDAVRTDLVRLLAAQGRLREALAELDRLAEPSRQSQVALGLRVELLGGLQDRPALLDALERLGGSTQIAAHERNAALDQAAHLAVQLGEPQRALRLIDALAAMPGAPPLDARRALIHEQLGNRRAALLAWEAALAETSEAARRLAIVDTMLGHARAIPDRLAERVALTRALEWSGNATDRMRDLVVFEHRIGRRLDAARRALELAGRSDQASDRADAFERVVELERTRSAPTGRVLSLLAQLDKIAARQRDSTLRRLIAEQYSRLGRDREAIALLEALARESPSPQRRQALLQLADLQGRRGDVRARALAVLAADELPEGEPLPWSLKLDALRALGRLDQATSVLEQARRRDPGDPEVLRRWVDLSRARADSTSLLEAYAALARLPGLPARERAQAHREAAEIARLRPEAMETALDHYRQAIALDPTYEPTRLALAEALAGRARHAEAAEAFHQLYRSNGAPEYLRRAAREALAAGDRDRAQAWLDFTQDQAARWPPAEGYELWLLRAELERDSHRPDAAMRSLEQALMLHPEGARAQRLANLRAALVREQAERLGRERRLGEAVSAWREAERLDPGPASSQGLAYALLRAGEPAGAAQAFRRALGQAEPPSVQLLSDLGYAHQRAGERSGARWAWTKAIDAMRESADAEFVPRIETLRREVRELDHDLRGALWQGWRGRGVQGAMPGLASPSRLDGVAGVPGMGGGAELAYRAPAPDGPGRSALEWFGRWLWALEPGTNRLDDSSHQLGLGVRYRPPLLPGASLSAERLIAIGEAAADDGLLRGAWGRGWGGGGAMGPGSVGHVWIDVAYQTGAQIRMLYGEVRQGYAYPMGANIGLIPHLIVHGRGLRPDPATEGWAEAGLGVAIEALSGGDRHLAPNLHWSGHLRQKRALDGAGRDGWEVGLSLRW
jgi:tetratricopeptide (TPR) repeat protein